MFKNYLLIAWRNITHNKLYTGIILAGLVVGLTCAMLVATFVRHELSYDRSIPHYERTYRVGFQVLENGVHVTTAKLAPAAAPYVKDNVAGIEAVVRMYSLQGNQFRVIRDEAVFNQDDVYFADPNVFSMFPAEFIEGSATTALDQPGKVVLTREAAEKYFGTADAVGKRLTLEGTNKVDVVVSAVVENLPATTHLNYRLLVSIDTLKTLYTAKILDTLADARAYTYIRVEEGRSREQVMSDLQVLFKRFQDVHEVLTPLLVRVDDIHLRAPPSDNEMKINGDINTVYVYVAIALVMLLVAAVNFMNLATARSSRRAKEVGIRKVLGATRGQLVAQFMIEAMALTLVAFVISALLAMVLIPSFGGVLGRDLHFTLFSDPLLLGGLLLVAVIVALLSGSYPALYLSAFEPAKVLKGDVTRGRAGALFRKSLVTFQFCVSAVLVVATVVVLAQMRFAEAERLGYNKEQVVTLTLPARVAGQYDAFRQQLLSDPSVRSVAGSSRIPTEHLGDMMALQIDGAEYAMYYYLSVAEDFFSTYEVAFAAGRPFARERSGERIIVPTEENPVTQAKLVVNESFVKAQGWSPEDAIGKTVDIQLSEDPQRPLIKTTVIGVANEMHFTSMRQKSRPAVFVVSPDTFRKVSIKVDAANIDGALKHINTVWDRFAAGEPMEAQFLDVRFDAMYHLEKRQAKVFTWLAGLTIVIAVFGLYGLVSYSTERRTKEIGIRKVLGASNVSIVMLFIKEYSWLVLLANVIGWPIAYMVMRDWLNGFEYRIDMNVVFFAIAALVTFTVAWLTVFTQAYAAAKARPVNSLRYE